MDGTALYQGVCPLHFSELSNSSLYTGAQVGILISDTASIGTAGGSRSGTASYFHMVAHLCRRLSLLRASADLLAGIDAVLDIAHCP